MSEEKDTSTQETIDTEAQAEVAENEVDYKALLEQKEKENENLESELSKYKDVANNQRIALQKHNKSKKEVDSESSEEDPAVRAARLAVQEIEVKRREEDIETMLESLTDNPDERALIRLTYQKDLNHSGYSRNQIKSDLEKAQLLANRDKYVAKAKADAKKDVAEEAALKQTGSTSRSVVDEPAPGKKYTKREKEFLRKMGVDV